MWTVTPTPIQEAVEAHLNEALGCFEAAYTEGLHDKMMEQPEGDPGSLRGLLERRILHAIGPIRSALTRLRTVETGGAWQPMETAPKSGTRILAMNVNAYYPLVVAFYPDCKFPWRCSSNPMDWVDGLTHWMPIPCGPLPTPKQEGQG